MTVAGTAREELARILDVREREVGRIATRYEMVDAVIAHLDSTLAALVECYGDDRVRRALAAETWGSAPTGHHEYCIVQVAPRSVCDCGAADYPLASRP